jgi:hypothetical protein
MGGIGVGRRIGHELSGDPTGTCERQDRMVNPDKSNLPNSLCLPGPS